MSSPDWQKASHIVQAALTRPVPERTKFIADACAGNELLQQEVEIMLRYYTASESAQTVSQAVQPVETKDEAEPLEQWWQPPRKSGKLSQPANSKPVESDLHQRPTDILPIAESPARNTAPVARENSTVELINELSSGSERLKSERQTGHLPPLMPQTPTPNSGAGTAPGAQNSVSSDAPPASRPNFDQASRRPVFDQPPQRVSFDRPTYGPLFAQQPAPPPKPDPPRSQADFDQDSFRTKFGFDQPSVRPPAEAAPSGGLRSPETRQLDGRMLAHYQLQYEIGRGGMGRVYLAEDTRLGRRVALKLLLRHSTRDPERVRRFQQEARAASGLNHPNILTIYEIGEHKGVQYLATEYVEGRTLRSLLDRGRFKVSIAVNIALQIASALETAHRANIVHRDIKPENLMLRPDGYVKVLDFGIAKLIEGEGETTPEAGGEFGAFETKPGVIVGTVNYMSPEQARGLRVDRRTDVFSLGVVLYEMITGHCPFTGPTQSDVLTALLSRDPEPLALQSLTAPLNVLQRLQHVLNRVLEKDRNLRYQSARELAEDLKSLKRELDARPQTSSLHGKEAVINNAAATVTESVQSFGETEMVEVQLSGETAAASPTTEQKRATTDETAASAQTAETAADLVQPPRQRRSSYLVLILFCLLALFGVYYFTQRSAPQESIAILPFEYTKASRVNEAEHEYLADGLTESLIQRLSQIGGLKVIARNSVFQYKGQLPEPRAVGAALNVRTVLTGRLTPRGENLTVVAELVDTRTSAVLWSQEFVTSTADLQMLQRNIANRITQQLQLRLTGNAQQRLASRDTENPEAYKLYLKGRHLWNQRTGDAIEKSIESFQRAVLLDPNYARAYAALADSYALAPIYGDLSPAEAAVAVKDVTTSALQLDPNLAEPYAALGFIRFHYEWNWAGAEQAYQRALELNDNYATAHHWYSGFLSSMGQVREALAEAERARELDPVSTPISTNVGAVLYYARRYDEAIQQFQRALELNPNAAGVHRHLGMAYEQKRDYAKALAAFQRAIELGKGDVETRLRLARTLALAGRQDEARRLLAELQRNAPPGTVPLYLVASIFTALGDNEQALGLLTQAVSLREEGIPWLKVDPHFDALRNDARFNDLLKSAGFVK
jgi:eukaryotic-like serine/threonine-protein kinase